MLNVITKKFRKIIFLKSRRHGNFLSFQFQFRPKKILRCFYSFHFIKDVLISLFLCENTLEDLILVQFCVHIFMIFLRVSTCISTSFQTQFRIFFCYHSEFTHSVITARGFANDIYMLSKQQWSRKCFILCFKS